MAEAKAFNQKTVAAKEQLKKSGGKQEVNWIKLLICVALGAIIWFIPVPEGLEAGAWHLFAIFVATILALIIQPVPLGTAAIIAITICILTGTTTVKEGLAGFADSTIWLIVIAFFISRGFIKTGLGSRIAYLFVSKFGKKTLGLAYSLAATDLILSPAMPSNTARNGGIIFPIVTALANTFGSRPEDGTAKKIGSFLVLALFNVDLVCSAMFMTSMAANPLAASLAADQAGVNLTWGDWALAAIVPGLVAMVVIPWVVYKLETPEIKETPNAGPWAMGKLKEMGPVTLGEKKMICVFILILALWMTGSLTGISATTTGLIGLSVLLLSGVLSWEDVKAEKSAWNTLVWFSALVMMAGQLNTKGFIPWFGNLMGGIVGGMPWVAAGLILALVYFFVHYIFASQTAQVTALYAVFLTVAIAAGVPPLLAAVVLGMFGNLNASLTHYACGPAAIMFSSGYVTQGKWWTVGLITGIVNIVIFLTIGSAWWMLLGYFA